MFSIAGTVLTIFMSAMGWMVTHSEQVSDIKFVLKNHELLREAVEAAVTERLEVHARVDDVNRRLNYVEARQDTVNRKAELVLFGKLPLDTVYRINRQGLLVRTPISSRWLYTP